LLSPDCNRDLNHYFASITVNPFTWELSPFVGRGFESFTGGAQVTTPGLGFLIRQFGLRQFFGQVAACANFVFVRPLSHKINLLFFAQASNRSGTECCHA
jgi:hypothetical protein